MIIQTITRVLLAYTMTALLCPMMASADDLLPGSVVLARTSPKAVLIWDATPVVTQFAASKTAGDAAYRQLEADAVRILAQRAPVLKALTIEIRVIYNPSSPGSNNPYGDPTASGLKRLVIVSAARADLLQNAAEWEKELTSGAPTKGLAVDVTGPVPIASP